MVSFRRDANPESQRVRPASPHHGDGEHAGSGTDTVGLGKVAASSSARYCSASAADAPHIDSCGRKLTQTAGRSGRPNKAHCRSGMSWMHGIPAGLPNGMPGMGEEMEGAMQHAPHPERHSMPESSPRPRDPQGRRTSRRQIAVGMSPSFPDAPTTPYRGTHSFPALLSRCNPLQL